MTANTSWQSGGVTVTVSTTKLPGQSVNEFLEAHAGAVRAALIDHPQD